MNFPTKLLDEMWRTVCKSRDGYRCAVCGKTEYLNVHHIIGRQNYGTRWLTENGVCLCPAHHKFDRHESAHINPLWFIRSYVSRDAELLLMERYFDEKDSEFYYFTLRNRLLMLDDPTNKRLLARGDRTQRKLGAADERRTKRSADRAARELARSTGNNRNGS